MGWDDDTCSNVIYKLPGGIELDKDERPRHDVLVKVFSCQDENVVFFHELVVASTTFNYFDI
jgi:hypothetical protein